MSYYCSDVKSFHDKFGLTTPSEFSFIPDDLHHFRSKFFHEEHAEFYQSFKDQDLPGAIDALIDLVYITCGCALLYGIQPEELVSLTESHKGDFVYSPLNTSSKPSLLPPEKTHELFSVLATCIVNYECGHDHKDQDKICKSLADLYNNSFLGAKDMGFSIEMWNELWNDVQRANMSKERALKASDSKRGSAWDVIKPSGWVGPRTEELVQKFLSD